MTWEQIVALVSSSVVSALLGHLFTRRQVAATAKKTEAEATTEHVNAQRQVTEMFTVPFAVSEKLMQQLGQRLDQMHQHIGRIEGEHEVYRRARNDEISALEVRIAELEARLELQDDHIEEQDKVILALRNEAAVWKRGVEVLIGQLERAGLQPDWRPPAASGSI
jgi:uncharacterized coiled-coil protein SlyX